MAARDDGCVVYEHAPHRGIRQIRWEGFPSFLERFTHEIFKMFAHLVPLVRLGASRWIMRQATFPCILGMALETRPHPSVRATSDLLDSATDVLRHGTMLFSLLHVHRCKVTDKRQLYW